MIIRVTTSVVEAFPAALCSSRSMGYDIVDCTWTSTTISAFYYQDPQKVPSLPSVCSTASSKWLLQKIGTKVTCVLQSYPECFKHMERWIFSSPNGFQLLCWNLPSVFLITTFTTFYSFSMCMDVCTSAYLWRLENLQNQFLPYTMWVLGIKLTSGLMSKQLYLLSHSFLTMVMIFWFFNIEPPPCVCLSVHVHIHAILPFAEKKMDLNYEISSLNTSFISLF